MRSLTFFCNFQCMILLERIIRNNQFAASNNFICQVVESCFSSITRRVFIQRKEVSEELLYIFRIHNFFLITIFSNGCLTYKVSNLKTQVADSNSQFQFIVHLLLWKNLLRCVNVSFYNIRYKHRFFPGRSWGVCRIFQEDSSVFCT